MMVVSKVTLRKEKEKWRKQKGHRPPVGGGRGLMWSARLMM
jgi:hypothetical protein